MASNFGWDLIYRPWGGEFVEIADWIVDCFSQCDQLFRLPLHEPMSAFPVVTDVGFTGGSPRYTLEEPSRFLTSRFLRKNGPHDLRRFGAKSNSVP